MGAVCLLALALALQLVTARPALAATLAASPSSGLPGSSTTLSGSAYDPLLPITLCWDGSGCSNLGIASAQGDGTFSQTVSVPAGALAGGHVINACQISCVSTSFEVLDTPTTTVVDHHDPAANHHHPAADHDHAAADNDHPAADNDDRVDHHDHTAAHDDDISRPDDQHRHRAHIDE